MVVRGVARALIIAIHRKPHTVLRCLVVQPRTVFDNAPCLKLSVDGYTYTLSAQVYVNRPAKPHKPAPPMSHEILRHVYWTFGSETCPDAHAFNEAVTACNTGLTWHLEHSA